MRVPAVRLTMLLTLVLLPARHADAEDKQGDTGHEIRLRSGTILVGRLKASVWKCATAFGELTIPVAEVRRVRFGRKSDPDRVQTVRALIKDLDSPQAARRDFAVAALREQGVFAAPDLKEHSVGAGRSAQVKKLCVDLLASLKEGPRDWPADDDRIETARFNLKGTVSQANFTIQIAELGAITVERRHIVELRAHRPSESHTFKVTGQHSPRTSWLDTKLQLKPGQRFKITAHGAIMFPQWGGNAFAPDGALNMGNWAGMPMGSLVGRMGTNGPMFKVGRFYAGAPAGKGTLHLCLGITVQGMASNGEYNVTVELEE